MVEIPEGEIDLRDDRIKRRWTVKVKAFLISEYPVTQNQYFDLTGENPGYFKGDNHPVESISWKEATAYCNLKSEREGLNPYYHFDKHHNDIIADAGSNGYRLPSDAEWEYACKAGTTGTRYGDIERIAWFRKNSGGITHEVGLKEPNHWGLYDMLGNVWEWCSDIYDQTEYGSYRIFRGGGWNDEERGCMATNRRRSHPDALKIDDLGFRLARNLL